MMADFFDTFNKEPDDNDIPQEVLDVLSEKLPSNFVYYKSENGKYFVGPSQECLEKKMYLNINIDKEFVDNQLKDIPKEKILEYIYRMQLQVPITNASIGNEEKKIPLEETVGNPLEDVCKIDKIYLYPEPFAPAKDIVFETSEGDKVIFKVERKPYPSFDESLFTNINFPAFQIKFYVSEKNSSSRVDYKIEPTKAESVSDAVAAIHMFYGLCKGTIKINGKMISKPAVDIENQNIEQWNDSIKFWETALKMEHKLGVKFNPGAKFMEEDARFFAYLNQCILNNKEIVWEHPFNHFHMGGVNVKDGGLEKVIGKESIYAEFTEGPLHISLLGAEFDIYCHTKMSNFVITNIQWENEKKEAAEIYISDPIDGKWKLSRKYYKKKNIDKSLSKRRK